MSSATATHNWDALSGRDDERPERDCDECGTLLLALERAKALLRTIRRMEARPAKRETPDDTPAMLEAVGHASYCAQIRTRIDLFLEEPELERVRRERQRAR